MSDPSGPVGTVSTPPARKSGCLGRGCLIGCLAPVVLLLIGLVLAWPALREQWVRWRAENPWVSQIPGVAAVVKDMAGGTGGEEEAASDTTASGRRASKRREGVNDRTRMPPDLPLWGRAGAETFSVGEGHAAAFQRVTAPPDSVLRFFRKAMPAEGWRLDQERRGAGGVLLLYRKADRIARVEVVADSTGTDVWLRSRASGAAPER